MRRSPASWAATAPSAIKGGGLAAQAASPMTGYQTAFDDVVRAVIAFADAAVFRDGRKYTVGPAHGARE